MVNVKDSGGNFKHVITILTRVFSGNRTHDLHANNHYPLDYQGSLKIDWYKFSQSLPKSNKIWKISKAVRYQNNSFSNLTTHNSQVVCDNVREANIIADVFENSYQITMLTNLTADNNVNKGY